MADTSESKSLTVADVIDQYLRMIERARSKRTMLAYKNALSAFSEVLAKKSMDPAVTPIGNLTEDIFAKFVEHLSVYSTATEQLYLQAVKGFYLFVDSENYANVNQSRLVVLIRQRARRPGVKILQFPIVEIEKLIEKVQVVDG
ncbi:MAG: site-specific integrase [Anaerolineales bacterium]|nr:site-specific integrase [Anaerolineales bacterium]